MDGWLEIGKIVAPQGLQGEMRVYPETDFPERFEVPGQRWLLYPGKSEPEPVELKKGRYLEGKKLYVIKLAGIEYRDQAEELRGCKLLVPETDRPQLGEDEYHVMDLIGLSVFLQESGKLIGKVIDVIPAGNDLLEVELQNSENKKPENKKPENKKPENKKPDKKKQDKQNVLIPFVRAIAPVVDLENSRIEITPPPGLLTINDK